MTAPLRTRSPFAAAGALALLAGVLGVQVLPALPPLHPSLAASVVAAVAAWRWPRWRLAWLLVLGAAWACFRGGLALELRLPHALEGADLYLVGRVDGLPRATPDGLRFDLLVEHANRDGAPLALRGRVRLADYRAGAEVRAGQRLALDARLKRPRGTQNPGGFDFERWALERRYAATGYVRALHATRPAPAHSIDAWREDAARAIAARTGADAAASVLRALAVGDQGALDEAAWQVLRATGTAHLIAISGFHIGLVAGFGALLARFLVRALPWLRRERPRQFVEAAAALGLATGYALLAGWSLPVQRTLLMIAAVLAAVALRRATTPGATLALAAWTCLLLDPLGVLGAGFWLSFAGVAWLVYCFAGRGREPLLREFTRAQAVMAVGLLPLSVWFFQQSSVVGPLANLVAVPWISLVVVPLLLLALAWLPIAGAVAGGLLDLAAAAMRALWWLLERLTEPAWSQWFLPEPDAATLALAVLGCGVLLLPRAVPGRALGAALLVPLVWPHAAAPASGDFELHVLDVGQGQAVLVRTARHAVLVDAGASYPAGFDVGSNVVVPALRALGIAQLDVLVISHADNDHAGGAPSVIAALRPARILAGPGLGYGEPCRAGTAWTLDGVDFVLLHPPPHFPDVGNDASCVLHVSGVALGALLPGDIEAPVEARLVAERARLLRADVVLAPHHGSRSSSTAAWVAQAAPRLAIVSAGHRNRYGHPHPDVVQRWRASGASVWVTATSGAITVRADPGGAPQLLRWRAQRRRYWHEP